LLYSADESNVVSISRAGTVKPEGMVQTKGDLMTAVNHNQIVESTMTAYYPGKQHPRIWRSNGHVPNHNSRIVGHYDVEVEAEMLDGLVAYQILADELLELFETIEPVPPNYHVFGHKIRRLLILACTEVEVSWRRVLEMNGLRKPRYTTNDYIRLMVPMRLDGWQLSLPRYPQLGVFTPFATWDAANPTQSLQWYDAYNAVKHDRRQIDKGTLQYTIEAVVQCSRCCVANMVRNALP